MADTLVYMPDMTEGGVTPRPRLDLTVHELDGEGLIFDPLTQDTHRLNSTAWFIWSLFDGRMTLQAITARVHERFDVTAMEASTQVSRMYRSLDSLGLFEPLPGEA